MKTLICIPVYNGSKYIKRTIESCLKQTCKVEIWVFDNCSLDSTYKIVNSYTLKNKNIKLFRNKKNLGRTGNWNMCLDKFMESKFKYIKFLFAGDQIYPECINKTEKIFSRYKNLGSIFFPYKFIKINGESSIYRYFNKNKLFRAKESIQIILSEGSQLGAIVGNVYSRSAIKNHRFSTNHVTKNDFDVKILEHHSSYYINDCLAIFSQESHNTFSSYNSLWGYFETAYVLAREHMRIKKTKKFSNKENFEIEQRLILSTIKSLTELMSNKLKFVLLLMFFKNILYNFAKSFPVLYFLYRKYKKFL